VIGNTSVVASRASLSRSFVYDLISAVFELCVTRVTSILKAKKAKRIHYWDSNYKLICIVQDFNNSFCHFRLSYSEVQHIEVCEKKVNFSSLWISFSSRYYILDGELVDSS
jgi:hypothetical protein